MSENGAERRNESADVDLTLIRATLALSLRERLRACVRTGRMIQRFRRVRDAS